MGHLKTLLQVLVVGFVIIGTHQQVKIKCYECVTPLGVYDAADYCKSDKYCQGLYCTKGPNSISNGIYRGCSDSPPLDKAGGTCKDVNNSFGEHTNCYCKNIDFCNDTSPVHESKIALIILLIVVTFFFIFAQ